MTHDPQRGSPGRPKRPFRSWVRSRPVRTMFRPQEIEDLREIASVWNVPVATVVWIIVVDQIARYRRRAPELGLHGLAIAAGLAVTRNATERSNRPAGGGG